MPRGNETVIRQIGGSRGVIIPHSIMDLLEWDNGDVLRIKLMRDGMMLRKVVKNSAIVR